MTRRECNELLIDAFLSLGLCGSRSTRGQEQSGALSVSNRVPSQEAEFLGGLRQSFGEYWWAVQPRQRMPGTRPPETHAGGRAACGVRSPEGPLSSRTKPPISQPATALRCPLRLADSAGSGRRTPKSGGTSWVGSAGRLQRLGSTLATSAATCRAPLLPFARRGSPPTTARAKGRARTPHQKRC